MHAFATIRQPITVAASQFSPWVRGLLFALLLVPAVSHAESDGLFRASAPDLNTIVQMPEPDGQRLQLAARMLDQAGLQPVLDGLPRGILRGWDKFASQAPLPPASLQATRADLAAATQAYPFLATATNLLARQLTYGDLITVAQWQQDSSGQALTAALAAAREPASPEQFRARLQRLRSSLSPDRETLIRELLQATGSLELNLAAAAGTESIVRLAAALLTQPSLAPAKQMILATVAAGRQGHSRHLVDQAFAAFLFTYGDVPAADLQAWLQFATSSTGQRWHQALAAAVAATLDSFFNALAPAALPAMATSLPTSTGNPDLRQDRR